jgi:hypothetical protein
MAICSRLRRSAPGSKRQGVVCHDPSVSDHSFLKFLQSFAFRDVIGAEELAFY